MIGDLVGFYFLAGNVTCCRWPCPRSDPGEQISKSEIDNPSTDN